MADIVYVRRAGGLLLARLSDGTDDLLYPTSTGNQWVVGRPNVAPVASFTHTMQDLKVTVNGSGSTDPDGTIASYAWNFGDGGTGTGATATHTYAAAGTYTVTLTVTDNKGATHVKTASVSAAEPPPPPTGGAWTHPLPGATLTSGYGESRGSYMHVGIDLSTTMVAPGAPIVAVADMKITIAIEDGTGGLPDAGSYVKGHSVSGPAYSFSHFHMHPGTIAVSVGQTVAAGTRLGLEGTSGNSTGPHLHFEIWEGHMAGDFFYWGDGTPPDPVPILNANGVYV